MNKGESVGRDAVIDGWRGISVLMVILGHLFAYRANKLYPLEALDATGLPIGSKILAIAGSLGTLGVCFFFMISGYLITTLLRSEESKRGCVSLKAFYVRRIFRIMPAFYAYVLVVYLLGRAGVILIDDSAVLRSSLYVCNFAGFACSWWLAHSWSLAVEEQFYLVWPIIFAYAAVARRRAAIALIAGLVLGSLFVPTLGSFVYIMVGVLMALFVGLRERLTEINGRWLWVSLLVLVMLPAAPQPVAMIVTPIKPVLAAVLMFGALFAHHAGALRNILCSNWLTKIGLVSYSLYLWQQMSLAPFEWGGRLTGAKALYDYGNAALGLAFIPAAIASYFLIEKPMVKLGHRLSRRVMDHHTPPSETAPTRSSDDGRIRL